MSNCLICAGYSSHNCPCCRPEPDWPMEQIGDGIDLISEQIQAGAVEHPDGIENEIWRWCYENLDPDLRDGGAFFMSDILNEERKMR